MARFLQTGERSFALPAQSVITLYRELSQAVLPELPESEVVVGERLDDRPLQGASWQYRVIGFIRREVEKKLSLYLQSFIIHGSFATRDFISGWSDLDTQIILTDRVFESVFHLNAARKTFRRLSLLCDKIDPLCHHRFSFLTQFDLRYYPQYFLPLEVYRYGFALLGENKLKVRLREDQEEKRERMKNFVSYFQKRVADEKYRPNQAEFKNDLAHLLLWPSLLLELKGLGVYKRGSFEKAKQEFPTLDFSIIDRVSAMRKDWREVNFLRYYPNWFLVFLPFWWNRMVVAICRRFAGRRSLGHARPEIREVIRQGLSFMEKSRSMNRDQL